MRERITYILPPGAEIDSSSIQVSKDTLKFHDASKVYTEHRITASLEELPEEIRVVLQESHELHVRWQSESNYKSIAPFFSRLPAGLHVFYTPLEATSEEGLCKILKGIFSSDLACTNVGDSFSRPSVLSERFASSATYQLHQELKNLKSVVEFVEKNVCKEAAGCSEIAAQFDAANYADIDYDAISHALTITAFWTNDIPSIQSATKEIKKWHPGGKVEVGILSPQKADEPEELSLGGYLTVLGEDEKPSGTAFSFPSRHHGIKAMKTIDTYSIRFQEPMGLHPKMVLSFSANTLTPPNEDCALHAYLTIPSSLFLDRYQLADPLFLDSQNLHSLRSISGEQDLEAPDWITDRWGSAALLELKIPSNEQLDAPWEATVPLHLRYLPPTNSTTSAGYRDIQTSWPAVFWACEAEEGLKMSVNPFDRTNLGYDGLFGPKTMFYHLQAPHRQYQHSRRLTAQLTVPTMDVANVAYVSIGTLVAVTMGFSWILWKLRYVFVSNLEPAHRHKAQ
ncbi:PIG-X-domain-containing protein [Polychaeton citri CBS 116435]|uniref:Protein PBN1 n=1 Tax=Polychaeton citri CBS 116435 TaxID=1314669 RepID=A0A9P4Q3E3_9PEZI|nr:PIG-X-domain-containing protein [Polychaeton citri CBS 116435]